MSANLALLIPTRNDRPKFLENCLRMMAAQTLPPAHIEIVNDVPVSAKKDITWRYRLGYERIKGKGFEVIALIEDDDFYSPAYLETMYNKWKEHGQPDLFGSNYTIYYHLKLRKYYAMDHRKRLMACACNTLIKPDLNFKWCADDYSFTDIHLWKTIPGKTFEPQQLISIGIKHGIGLCGTQTHTRMLHRFEKDDKNFCFLRENTDTESMNFYERI